MDAPSELMVPVEHFVQFEDASKEVYLPDEHDMQLVAVT